MITNEVTSTRKTGIKTQKKQVDITHVTDSQRKLYMRHALQTPRRTLVVKKTHGT